MKKPLVSLIIRVKNEGVYLKELLKRISLQKTDFDYDIIIVYSKSKDNTLDIIRKNKCKLVNLEEKDFTWGKALNLGLSKSKSKYALLVSAHCFPTNNFWLTNFVKNIEIDEKIAAVYGRQIQVPHIDPFEGVELYFGFPPKKGILSKKLESRRSWISNANCILRKSVWKTEKFDETVSSGEDALWEKNVIKKGFKVLYSHDAKVYHSHILTANNLYRKWYARSFELQKKYKNNLFKLISSTLKFMIFDILAILKQDISFLPLIPFYETYRFRARLAGYLFYKHNKYLNYKKIKVPRSLCSSVIDKYTKKIKVKEIPFKQD